MKKATCIWVSKPKLVDVIHDLNTEALRCSIDCPVHGLVENCLISAPQIVTTNQVNHFQAYCEKCEQQYAVPLHVILKIEEVAS